MQIEHNKRLNETEIMSLVEPAPGSNRAQRRLAKHHARIMKRQTDRENGEVAHLKPLDDILTTDADEAVSLKADLEEYNSAQRYTKLRFAYYNIWLSAGLSQDTAKKFLVPGVDSASAQAEARLQVNSAYMNGCRAQLNELQRSMQKSKRYVDEEEIEIIKNMDKAGLSVQDMFREVIRSRGESIGLMEMQMDYLRDQEQKKIKIEKEERDFAQLIEEESKIDAERDETEESGTVDQSIGIADSKPADKIVERYPLADWDIKWTDTYWSDNPNHLHAIPTGDRQAIIAALGEYAQGNISINLGSVARALEFHLVSRDVIQKALATRNKYAPEEVRRWVKVKRGKDRIGILLPKLEEKKAIFFVGGRDNVYRGIN